jgi:hypothetical protein
MEHRDAGARNYSQIIWGAGILAFGLLLFADRREWLTLDLSAGFWPVILIALGAGRLAQPPDPAAGHPRRAGGFLLFVGVWALLTELHVGGLDYRNSWPLIVIGVGVAMVWRALQGDPICGRTRPRGDHAA